MTETKVFFTTGSTRVVVTLTEGNATTRAFLAMLPMTVSFTDFNGMEKVAYPRHKIDGTTAAGMTPRTGDFFTYVPWGNIGFFYDTDLLGFSEDLARIGTTDDLAGVLELDGQQVTITHAP